MKMEKIPLKQILPDKNQPRKKFDEEQITLLSKSIQRHGLLQPIVVKKQKDHYTIIAGERRYRACVKLGLDFVNVVVREEENSAELALIENIQRENLTALEEARAILSLKEEKGYTHEELSKVLGKTRSYISNKLRLLTVDSNTKKLLETGKISEGHARALLAMKDIKDRANLAKKILAEGLSVRDTEKEGNKRKKKKSLSTDSLYEEYEEALEEKFLTKVRIQPEKEGGKLTIEFYNQEQLEGILGKLLGEYDIDDLF